MLGCGVFIKTLENLPNIPLIDFIIFGFGLGTLIFAFLMPSEFLGVETRGGSKYMVKVNADSVIAVIEEIEKRRKEAKNQPTRS
jgi:hypothetical protein